MLPDNVLKLYKANLDWCYDDSFSSETGEFVVTDQDKEYFINELGIKNVNSAFIDFFSIVGMPLLGKGDELYPLEEIIDLSESDEYPESIRMSGFLQMSSSEGEASYFYNKYTDEVYDIEWGEEEDMVQGSIEPIYKTFYDFLSWYYSDRE